MTTASSPLAHNAKNRGQNFPAATAADSASGSAAYRRAGKNRKMYANLYALPRRAAIDWIAFGTLMVLSAAVFFINLTASGYANEFYSAAAQAGSKSWWAFLWGSSDSGNAITVDKPPASIWLMALSVRIFGLNSFAILLPQAVMGVLTTFLIYSLVRRYWGNWAGIIAGAAFITTPVAALMFRFNNPDALLVLLMVGACYASLRALEYDTSRRGNMVRTGWMALAGVLVGFGFLTKQFQVLLILPGIAAAFLIASPTGIIRRIVDGLAAILSMVIAAGWWVLLTVLVPASKRPYIGGSQNNSFIELTFGYNGLGRITGNETGSVVPGGGKPQGGMWGQTGWSRLFTSEFSTQITWLALFAFAGIVIGLIDTRTSRRTDLRRASVVVFGGWLAVTWLVFSFMSGIFHAYYTVAFAPAAAILAAIAIACLWSQRDRTWAPLTAAALVIVTTIWSSNLINTAASYAWLSRTVLITGIVGGLALAVAGVMYPRAAHTASAQPIAKDGSAAAARPSQSLIIVRITAVALSAAAVFAGPVAWTSATVLSGHHGSIVTAGPNSGGPGGAGGPGGGASGGMPGGAPNGSTGNSSQNPAQDGAGNTPGTSRNNSDSRNNGTDGQNNTGTQGGNPQNNNNSSSNTGNSNTAGGPGGGGGFLGGSGASNNSAVVSLLKKDADKYRWAAATTASQSAASYQLASEEPVMAIGGFNGTDAYPTLAQFKEYVKQGLIHYYISGGEMGGGQQNGGSSNASQIAQWVAKNFTAKTVNGTTIYDLTASK